MTKILITEAAEALLALENERNELFKQAKEISHKQQKLMADTACEMLRLSGEHGLILDKLSKLEETADKIYQSV